MDQLIVLAFQLIVLLFSVMIHEISHGAVALMLGDTTAKDADRLTLNPVKHIDLFGSIILPILLFITSHGSFVIGWAKPVPYNPARLKNPKLGAGLIGLAGPLSNFFIAVVFGLLLRVLSISLGTPLGAMFIYIISINILLAAFNLLPIPPLDGSSVLFAFLPDRFRQVQYFLTKYGLIILVLLILVGGFDAILGNIVSFVYRLIVGQNLF